MCLLHYDAGESMEPPGKDLCYCCVALWLHHIRNLPYERDIVHLEAGSRVAASKDMNL